MPYFHIFTFLEVKACDKKITKQFFFTALFHDLPEALTRDIISPVKYSVDELSEIIAEYEVAKIEDDILPNIPINIQEEFSYILGISKGIKEEFANKVK